MLLILILAFSITVSNNSSVANAKPQERYSFAFKWGSLGLGNSQFVRPHDVGFDSQGNVYVTDRDLNNIQKFTHDGKYLTQWGKTGSGDGEFDIPYSLSFDSSGNIYVTDRENSRIQKFNSNGTFLAKYGTDGKGNGQFHRPEEARIEPHTGDIYVTDTYNSRVQRFDKNFNFITKWGSNGTADGQFNRPHSIGFDSQGRVYVDDLDRPGVQIFDKNGKFLGKWGTKGTGLGEFSVPEEHLRIDSKDHIFIVDGSKTSRVQVFDTNGNFITSIAGGPCEILEQIKVFPEKMADYHKCDGKLFRPEHVNIDSSGNVYVVDRGNQRVEVFKPLK